MSPARRRRRNRPPPAGARLAAWRIALACLALLTSACVPVKMSFYRPGAPEGVVARNVCPSVDNLIVFEKQQVTVKVAAYMVHDAANGSLTFLVPEGRTVQLLGQQVEVSTEATGTANGVLGPGSAWSPGAFQPKGIAPDQPMPGRSKSARASWLPFSRAPGQPRHISYSFRFAVPLRTAADPAAFTLRLPSFRVDDTVIVLPPILFRRDSKLVISGLNC